MVDNTDDTDDAGEIFENSDSEDDIVLTNDGDDDE
jgi:hypothetical protein